MNYKNIIEWQRRIDICKSGAPLDFLGSKLSKYQKENENNE